MKGQKGVRERGEEFERLVVTHMLESGHAQLHFHKIFKILVCRLSGCPSGTTHSSVKL